MDSLSRTVETYTETALAERARGGARGGEGLLRQRAVRGFIFPCGTSETPGEKGGRLKRRGLMDRVRPYCREETLGGKFNLNPFRTGERRKEGFGAVIAEGSYRDKV